MRKLFGTSFFPFLVIFFVNVGLRLPCIYQDRPPFSFCDEDMILLGGHGVYQSKDWVPPGFLYGGLNYYLPAIPAKIWTVLTGKEVSYDRFLILGRVIFVVLLSSLAAPITFLTARRLFTQRRMAWLGAGLMTFSPMALGLSRYAYPDHFIVFFSALILYFSAKIFRDQFESEFQRVFSYLMVGGMVGLAIGVKYHALVALLVVFLAHCLKDKNFLNRNSFRGTFSFSYLWICCGMVMVGFLVSNPYVIVWPSRLIHDFQHNVHHYEGGHVGLMSDHGILFYLQVVYLTSFGIGGGLLYLLGLKEELRVNSRRAILLAVFPLVLIVLLGRYRVVINRNIAPVMPFIFLVQAVGLNFVFERIKKTFSSFFRLAQAFIFILLLGEGIYKTSYAYITDFFPDSRAAAVDWFWKNVQPGTTVGFSHACWGVPVGADANVKIYSIPVELKPGECLPYYVMDSWFYEGRGPGVSLYAEPIYANLHFVNPSRFSFPDMRIAQDKFLEQYDKIAEFGLGYHGPVVWIFRKKVPCPS